MDPRMHFDTASRMIKEIRQTLNGASENQGLMRSYVQHMAESMANMIFGSNMQEQAGLGHDETARICIRIFDGEDVQASDIDVRTRQYQENLEFLAKQRNRSPDSNLVILSRAEIIQHAKALHYIVSKALNRDEPLTERLILETHRILCEGQSFAGRYRQTLVMAGETEFCKPSMVPTEVGKLIEAFNKDVRESEEDGTMDPFYLAADIAQDFVFIHPFQDGNGRMCRLLLNAYLVKYAGVIVSIGEREQDRKKYLDFCKEASDPDHEEEAKGKLAMMVLKKGAASLRALKEKLHR